MAGHFWQKRELHLALDEQTVPCRIRVEQRSDIADVFAHELGSHSLWTIACLMGPASLKLEAFPPARQASKFRRHDRRKTDRLEGRRRQTHPVKQRSANLQHHADESPR